MDEALNQQGPGYMDPKQQQQQEYQPQPNYGQPSQQPQPNYGQPSQQPQPNYGQPSQQPYYDPQYQQQQQQQQQQQSVQQQTVIIQQPGGEERPPGKRDWTTGLFGCFEDIPSCVMVAFCGECYACYLMSKAGESCCMAWPGMEPCGGGMIGAISAARYNLRHEQNIEGSLCKDMFATTCCFTSPCVLCQLSREIDNVQHAGHMA